MVCAIEYVPPRLTVPCVTRMVPAPETVESAVRVDVLPLNSRVADAATNHGPVPVAAGLRRKPLKVVVPVWRSTVPVLLNVRPIVVSPLPADLRNVPTLLNTGDPPPLPPIGRPVCTSNVPLLLNVPPSLKMMVPPPVHVAVPLLSTRRPWSVGKAVTSNAIPPLAKVVPDPDMVPSCHVNRPLTETSPLPAMAPLCMVR